jgi:hypothetical protein
MNAFYEHHKNSISFQYRCFDRILLNGLIQPFQQPESVVGFFSRHRETFPVSRDVLRRIADETHTWIKGRAEKRQIPIVEPPEGRRDEFVRPYFRQAKADEVVLIIRAREPARILASIGSKKSNQYHLEFKRRWVIQYNVYVNDHAFGPMFIRVCPYFPFSARICLNQHHWLANQMRERGIRFTQCNNAFLRCSDPDELQRLADSMQASDLLACGHKWLAHLTPFFTDAERKHGGCQHRLFFSQVEYCDNLVFRRRFALDALAERLLDANRTIGQPKKLAMIFGHKVTKYYKGKLETVIEDLDLPNPVIRSYYKNSSVKQYVRDLRDLRTEATSNNVRDLGIGKTVENLPQVRDTLHTITDRYLDVQQDILESFVDRGELRRLSEPSITAGKRLPGLKLDHPRQLALMHALVRFANVAAEGTFSTSEIQPHVAKSLGCTTEQYTLASLRYDLAKLRAKGLVQRIGRSRRYQLTSEGYRLCITYVTLSERIYAPLTSGILKPFTGDAKLEPRRTTRLDRLYRGVVNALDALATAVGLRPAA